MKLLLTMCTVLLTAAGSVAIFAQSNDAFAQAPSAQQQANVRIVNRLKPEERARFAVECKSVAASDRNECIVTRAFVVQCRAVVDKKLDPILLWAYPGNFIVKYLSSDGKPVVLQALRESTAALEAANHK